MAEPGELRVDYDDVGTTLETLREAASNFEEANEKAFADKIMSEIKLFQCYADEAMENLRTTDEAYKKKVEETNG